MKPHSRRRWTYVLILPVAAILLAVIVRLSGPEHPVMGRRRLFGTVTNLPASFLAR